MPRTCRSVNKEEREGSLRKEVTSPQGHLPVHAGAEGLLTQRGAALLHGVRRLCVCNPVTAILQSLSARSQSRSPLRTRSFLVFSWHPRESLQPELAAWGFTGFPFGGATA